MENKEDPAAAAVPEKEASSSSSSWCFKRTVGEDASLLEKAKDQYKQFTEAEASEHWECIKNKVSSMFAEPIPFFGGAGAKDHGSTTTTTPSVKSQ